MEEEQEEEEKGGNKESYSEIIRYSSAVPLSFKSQEGKLQLQIVRGRFLCFG
jgi:hypothetical protein